MAIGGTMSKKINDDDIDTTIESELLQREDGEPIPQIYEEIHIEQKKEKKRNKKDDSNVRDEIRRRMRLNSIIDYPECYIYADYLLKLTDKQGICTDKERRTIETIVDEVIKNG